MANYFTELTVSRPGHLGGENWILKGLNEITVLFGKNGSGKSMLLRNLKNTDTKVFHYIVPERAGEISHDINTSQQQLDATTRANTRKQNFSQTFSQEAISRIQALFLKSGFMAMEKKEVPVTKEKIEELLHALMPEMRFKIIDKTPHFELRRIETDEPVTTINQLSSGEVQVLTLGLDLLTICSLWELDGQPNKVLLIDEPDTHLHPDLQQHLGRFFVELLNQYNVQIIIATHSTTLLSAIGYHGGERTSVIYLNNAKQDQEAIKFDKILQELSTCLGGHALMGPLFNAPLLLVEGDDDYKIWSHVPRYHKIKLAVIPCEGGDEVKKYQKTLEKLFANLRTNQADEIGYALLDSDKPAPQEDGHNPQRNIKYLNLVCRESENLYLSDEVLSLIGTTWEASKQKIKQESDKYGAKKITLDQCEAWDRKTVDVKDIVNQIAEILDVKKVPWTLRVAKCIGDKKPEGQIAEFLGNNVVEALWE